MKKSFLAVAIVSLLGAVASAQAATITFSADQALTRTNWTSNLLLGKFDTHLGTLTSIDFSVTGLTQGTSKVENKDAIARNFTTTLSSTFTLSNGSTTLVTAVNPVFSQNFSFTAYDGRTDFAGTSGASTGLISHSQSNSFHSTSAADFAAFSANGGGNISLALAAVGASRVIGSGNFVSSITTQSGGNVSVTYNYLPVPEPETYAMMLAGLGLLGLTRRRSNGKKIG
jgi:hypothetical protein